jgi:PBP1b-binding outer membrane lipoprotein LpoB
MKKFLAIALIATSFVACNDSEKTETEVVTSDTLMTTPVDTMMTSPIDTTTTPMVDTMMHN